MDAAITIVCYSIGPNIGMRTMKVREMRNALKEAPGDAIIKVLTYGYSQGTRDRFDIYDDLVMDEKNDLVIITVYE